MKIVKKHLTNGQYLTQSFEKFSQFLHHTVCTNAMSAWRWWNSTPDRVGTPYIIDRDGTIIECFDPSLWAFHLGIKGDDNFHEKHSVNIELVAAGQLYKVEGEYRFYPLYPNIRRYTTITEDQVYEFDKPWKGHKYWHIYTEAQLESLKWLLGKNMLEFPSLNMDNDLDKIFDYDPKVVKDHLHGLFTHGSVRKDKLDVFPYPPLIKALKELKKEFIPIKKASIIKEVKIKSKSSKSSIKNFLK